ncbi:hypothetical protein [Agriterribacter sp.]|uniref:hypothetical protein n=1 Tax=Agriterribacter sp. TaxID=2821509 RepID=UPI002C1328FE|nr:hypothetical protein [Agriterribacter sp.]HTN08889.1 hypothetical protein [Agriterribacter sp.]
MDNIFEDSFNRLKGYCEREGYKGWDPYDGLTSKIFQGLPLIRNNRFFRLTWIQLFKRNPVNLRPLVFIAKEYNAKGLGLFLTGYCNLYKTEASTALSDKIHFLANKIIELQCTGYSGSCWGYYFDWQARAFFQPADTPTVVATSFVADALFNAFEITGETKYRDTALSASNFVLKDLNRTYDAKGDFSFSYSPIDHTIVFNASLLGAKLLSRAYYYTLDETLKLTAQKAVQFSCDHQQGNGAWSYGTLPYHSWIDNFHTGFNLECIHAYQLYAGDDSFTLNIDKGLKYYIETFFTNEGISKYYHNSLYPIDIHAPAQLIVTLAKLGQLEQYRKLAEKVLLWTITHMQDESGYFFYQRKRYFSSRIPYMRWAQAWMFYALSYYKTYR